MPYTKKTDSANKKPDNEITQANMRTSNTSSSKPYMTQSIKELVRETKARFKLLSISKEKNRINPMIRIRPPAIFFRFKFIYFFVESNCFPST